ncbi:hypothetical protein LTR95_010195, partial [Oleoguttula sp. CCFEE 5521]
MRNVRSRQRTAPEDRVLCIKNLPSILPKLLLNVLQQLRHNGILRRHPPPDAAVRVRVYSRPVYGFQRYYIHAILSGGYALHGTGSQSPWHYQ